MSKLDKLDNALKVADDVLDEAERAEGLITRMVQAWRKWRARRKARRAKRK